MQKRFRAAAAALLCIAMSFSVYGCGEAEASTPPQSSSQAAVSTKSEASVEATSEPVSEQEKIPGDWLPKEPLGASLNEEAAVIDGDVSLDVSSVSKGYAAVKAVNANRLKFQVVFGERKYNYDLPGDGSVLVVPLQSGNGTYVFRVLENISDNKYAEVFSYEQEVTLDDEYQAFLHPSSMVLFTESSKVTEKAKELAAGITNDADYVAAVFEYLKGAVSYDYDFADSKPEMYYPSPDATLESGKGICFDYAATAAAMMRSVGIPAKLITGYVTPGDIYHAWNMIYLKDKGWITVEISVNGNTWQLIDITFASTGESETAGLEYKDKDVY